MNASQITPGHDRVHEVSKPRSLAAISPWVSVANCPALGASPDLPRERESAETSAVQPLSHRATTIGQPARRLVQDGDLGHRPGSQPFKGAWCIPERSPTPA